MASWKNCFFRCNRLIGDFAKEERYLWQQTSRSKFREVCKVRRLSWGVRSDVGRVEDACRNWSEPRIYENLSFGSSVLCRVHSQTIQNKRYDIQPNHGRFSFSLLAVYQRRIYRYGAVSAELLKNYLQGIGKNPTTLLTLSAKELKAQRASKSEGTMPAIEAPVNNSTTQQLCAK